MSIEQVAHASETEAIKENTTEVPIETKCQSGELRKSLVQRFRRGFQIPDSRLELGAATTSCQLSCRRPPVGCSSPFRHTSHVTHIQGTTYFLFTTFDRPFRPVITTILTTSTLLCLSPKRRAAALAAPLSSFQIFSFPALQDGFILAVEGIRISDQLATALFSWHS